MRPGFFRQRAKNATERLHIALARRQRKLHPGDNNCNPRVPRPGLLDDGLEIRAHFFDRHPAERIVDPERENQDINLFPAKERWQPAESVGRGIAALTGVNHSN